MSLTLALKGLFRPLASCEDLMLLYAEHGSADLLSALYERSANDLYHFLLTLTDAGMAEEISQRTWLRLMEKRATYHAEGKFKAWLFTLARHLLMDEWRAQQRLTDELPELSAPATDEQTDIQVLFNRALLALPFTQREAFCLQQEGFSLSEIASITGSEQETVKSRLRYAKDHLKTLLRGHL